MMDLVSYEPIELRAEDKAELQTLMSEAFVALSFAATEMYGFPKTKKLRDDFKSGKVTLRYDPRARTYMTRLIANEERIIRGYIRLGVSLCNRFDRSKDNRPGVTYGDYLLECAASLYDAMYCFNGAKQNEFSTYATWCMKNRLIDFARREEQACGVGKKVKKLRLAVKREMEEHGTTFDAAIEKLRQTADIDAATVEKVRYSMYKMSHIEQDDEHGAADHDGSEAEAMKQAIAEAPLTDIQRELVTLYLSGEKGFQTRMAETRINPNTGRLYTKQLLSQLFVSACQIIRGTYNEKEGRVAA